MLAVVVDGQDIATSILSLSFSFCSIGLVDWWNTSFGPMINENDVIWLERRGEKKKKKKQEKQW